MNSRKNQLIYPFFSCNLKEDAPWVTNPDVRERYAETVKTVKARHEKLADAFALCETGLLPCVSFLLDQEEAFSELAAEIFKRNDKFFDMMTAEELATAACSIYDGRICEERVDWAGCRPLYDTRFVTTKDWELLRIVGIGGSESAIIQGCNSHECQRSLYHKKIGTPMTDEVGAVLERGHIVEPVIYNWLRELKGFTAVPEFRMMQSIDYPNCTGNFDGIMRKNGTADYYLFEAKTANAENHLLWAGNRIPANYLTQTTHYCGVIGDPRLKGAFIACFFFVNQFEEDAVTGDKVYWFGGAPNDKTYREIQRDEEAERKVLEEAQDFWDSFIELGEEPSYSYSSAEQTLVDKIRNAAPLKNDTIIIDLADAANKDLIEVLNAYYEADKKVKAATAEANAATKIRDAYAPEIIKALGDHTDAKFVGGKAQVFASYKSSQSRRSCDYGKLEAFSPEAYAICVSKKPTKPSLKVDVIA